MKSLRNAFVHFAFFIKHSVMDHPVLLRDDLIRLRECGPWLNEGICDHVTPCNEGYLEALFMRWPAGSGNPVFPIRVSGCRGSELTAYIYARRNGTLWDKSTEYGRARWELLDWLIAEDQRLTEELLNGDKS